MLTLLVKLSHPIDCWNLTMNNFILQEGLVYLQPGDNGDSSTDSDDVERGDSDHSDNDDDEPMQCMPS